MFLLHRTHKHLSQKNVYTSKKSTHYVSSRAIHIVLYLCIVVYCLIGIYSCQDAPLDPSNTREEDSLNSDQLGGATANINAGTDTHAGTDHAGTDHAGTDHAGTDHAGTDTHAGDVAGTMQSSEIWSTEEIYEGLTPLCSSCHSQGQSFPAFASLSNFRALIVNESKWIQAGQATASAFLDLMLGNGPGTYMQMPPSGPLYADVIQSEDYRTIAPTITQIRDWINHLTLNNDQIDERCINEPIPRRMTRLNRLEYTHAIRDIFKVSNLDFNFPSENESYGFAHISELMTISPLLVEKYFENANKIVDTILPKRSISSRIIRLEIESDLSSEVGMGSNGVWNLWSNGLLSGWIEAEFTGRYEIRAQVAGGQAGDDPVRFAIVLDGQEIATGYTEEERPSFETWTTSTVINAGSRSIGIRFLNDYYCSAERVEQGICPQQADRNLYIDYLEIEGPQTVDLALTPFEQEYMQCDVDALSIENCSRNIISQVARLAWRRSLSADEMDEMWLLVRAELDEPEGWIAGIRQALRAVLLSPHFMFRVEVTPLGQRLSALELADRLAAFLWRSVPDQTLLNAAEQGNLNTTADISTQVSRMLRDEKSSSLIHDFATRWLELNHLDEVRPDPNLFSNFTAELRTDMYRETLAVIETIIAEDRSWLDLINADFTWVTPRLAYHYDMQDLIRSSDPNLTDLFEQQINNGQNDVEERANGSLDVNSSDLELAIDDSSTSATGLRFVSVSIPHGATIDHAYIQFTAHEESEDNTLVQIVGQRTENANSFDSASPNLSTRSKTNTKVDWAVPPWDREGATSTNERTPNLAFILQELIDQPTWQSGNDMVFIFTGSGSRKAVSYDSSPTQAPLLHIEYSWEVDANGRVATTRSLQRVVLPQAERLGFLTHGSWLTLHSQPNRTSPVLRGKWVLENLLCMAPPPPPANVEGLPEAVDQNASLRERLEQHRADPACAACHIYMDGIGFGLELFDAVGHFRLTDQGEEINSEGTLPGDLEVSFSRPVELAQALRQHPNISSCISERFVIYALGRGLSEQEKCLVDEITTRALELGFRLSDLVYAIVQSPLFLHRGQLIEEVNEEINP